MTKSIKLFKFADVNRFNMIVTGELKGLKLTFKTGFTS